MDLKQPGRRAKWTTTGSVLMKPATSAHVSDVVHMAFWTSNVSMCSPQVNVSSQSNFLSFLYPFNIVLYQGLKKETFFLLFVEGWVCGT